MDWDLKVPTWDSALEQDNVSVINSADITSTSILDCPEKKRSDFSVDLKLCNLGDFESPNKWKEQLGVSTPAVSPSGSSKTIRLRSNGNLRVSCSVDGCKSDLGKCKEYHRRHKVCEVHTKTAVVVVGGKEMRFCQQCSRFHSLVEFDEVKRSCRKRLDGHNRRRRKPCPDLTNSGSLLINLQGGKLLSYPHMFQNRMSTSEWTSMAKIEDDMLRRDHQPFQFLDDQKRVPGFYSYKNEEQIPFSQELSMYQAVPEASSSSDTRKTIFFSGGQTQVLNSNRAFSLLSPQIHTPSISIQNTSFFSEIPTAQPFIQSSRLCNNLQMCSHPQVSGNVTTTGSQMVDGHISSVISSDSKDADLNCHGFFREERDERDSSHAPQFLPFSWS